MVSQALVFIYVFLQNNSVRSVSSVSTSLSPNKLKNKIVNLSSQFKALEFRTKTKKDDKQFVKVYQNGNSYWKYDRSNPYGTSSSAAPEQKKSKQILISEGSVSADSDSDGGNIICIQPNKLQKQASKRIIESHESGEIHQRDVCQELQGNRRQRMMSLAGGQNDSEMSTALSEFQKTLK